MRSKLSHPSVRPSSGWRRNLWKQTLWRQPWSPNPVTTIGYGQREAGAEAWCRRFGTGCRVQPDGLERDDFSSNRHPALSFCLSMISGQTLRVCPEGKPVSTFPDHALALSHCEKQKYGQQRRGAKNEGCEFADHTMGRAILRSRAMRLGCSKLLDALVGCLGPPFARLVFCPTAR